MRQNFFLFFYLIIPIAYSQNTLVKTSENALFREGMELLTREKYGAAREAFQQYTMKYPGTMEAVDAEYYTAVSALNLFHPDAETLFQDFIYRHPSHSKSSLAYYDLGNFYYQEKKYEKAIEYLEKVNTDQLSENQKLESNFKLAYSHFSQKDFEKAGPIFNTIKNSNHKYTYAASYYAGYIEFRNGEYEPALTDLRKAAENEQYKPLVPFMIVNVYYKQGALDELIRYADEVLKSNEKIQGADEFYLLTGEAYYRKRDYKNASEYFNKYLSEVKAKPPSEVLYRLGVSEYKIENYQAAVTNLKGLVSTKDSIGQSSAYYLGLAYLKTNNKQFALTSFDLSRKSSFSKETQEEALFNLGKVNFDIERYNDAIPPLKEFVKSYTRTEHSAEANELLSEAFLRTNNYTEAISYIESLKTRSPRINGAYQRVAFYKGIEYFNNSKYPEAIQMFDKSIAFPVENSIFIAAHFWKGEAYSINREFENAIKNYSSVFQNSSGESSEFHLKSRYGIGYAYYNTKQYEKALPHFQTYVDELKDATTRQNYDDALLRLADLYYVTKSYAKSVKYYDLAIEQRNADIDYAYYQRGVALEMNNQLTDAQSSFEMVIKRYPSSLYYDDAIFQKAQVDLESSNYQAAIDGFSLLINSKATSGYVPYALLKRAISYNNLQKYDPAIADYKTILSRYTSHPAAHNALLGIQESLNSAGRQEEFTEVMNKYKEVYPQSEALVNIEYENAKSLFNDQKYKQAADAFTNYTKNYPASPNNADSRYYIAESYFRIKDMPAALRQYKVVVAEKKSSFYNRSVQRIAELEFANGTLENAIGNYRILLSFAANKKEKFSAWTGLMESYYKLAKYDSVNFYAGEILNNGNPTIDAENKALLYQGKVAYVQQQYDKATDYFINTLNTAKDENGAEAQYLIADIQFRQKQYKQSIETLFDLNNTFSIYDNWLGKSYLLIADNFVAQDEIFQAKATLNSIIDKSPHKESVEKAKLKLIEIENKGKNEAKEDSTDAK